MNVFKMVHKQIISTSQNHRHSQRRSASVLDIWQLFHFFKVNYVVILYFSYRPEEWSHEYTSSHCDTAD